MTARCLRLTIVLALAGIACDGDNTSETPSSPSPTAQCSNLTSQMFANQFWQDTGVFTRAGNSVRIVATGTWGDSLGVTDANGRGSQPVTGPSNVVPIPGLPIMRLIGRIGTNGSPFAVTTLSSFVSNTTGSLFLTPNDRSDSLSDNFGSLTVFVTVCP